MPPTCDFFPRFPFPLKPGEPLCWRRLIKQSIWRGPGNSPLSNDSHYYQQIMKNKHGDRCLSWVQACAGIQDKQKPLSWNAYVCPSQWLILHMRSKGFPSCLQSSYLMRILHLHQNPTRTLDIQEISKIEFWDNSIISPHKETETENDQPKCCGKRNKMFSCVWLESSTVYIWVPKN